MLLALAFACAAAASEIAAPKLGVLAPRLPGAAARPLPAPELPAAPQGLAPEMKDPLAPTGDGQPSASAEAQTEQAAGSFDGSRAKPTPAIAGAGGGIGGLPISTFQLPNGLTVVVQSDHSSPIVAVSVTYRVGSMDERRGRSGFAHLFEHLMFQGTKNIAPQQYAQLITNSGGKDNAFTDRRRTSYYEIVPRGALELALWAEAERMHTLNVDARALANEQKVVLEEMRMRYLNQPYVKASDAGLSETAFTRWENQHTTIGELEDIRDAKLEDVQAFYKAHYAPNNAVLTLAGDVSVPEATALVAKYFSAIPAGPVERSKDVSEPAIQGERRRVIEDPLAQNPHLVVGWHGPPRDSADFWPLMVVNQIIGGGDSSPLYQSLVKDAGLALHVETLFPRWSAQESMRGPDLMAAFVVPAPGTPVEAILGALDEGLRALASNGPDEAQLELAKAQSRLSWLKQLQRLQERATLLGSYTAFVGAPARLAEDLASVAAVTAQDVKRVVQRWLVHAGRAVVSIVPGASGTKSAAVEIAVPDDQQRAPGQAPPIVLPATAKSLPEIRRFTLANGLSVAYVQDRRLPLLEARLLTPAGELTAGEQTLSVALSDLYAKGTPGRDAAEIARAIERLGFVLSAVSKLDTVEFRASGLAENSEAFLRELAALLSAASYPEDEVELWKVQAAQALKDIRLKPSFLTQEKLKERLFAGHPYGKSGIDEAEVRAVTPERLRALHQASIRPEGSKLVVSGPLAPDEARGLIERALSSWSGSTREPAVGLVPESRGNVIDVIDRPASQQVNLTIAQWIPLTPKDPEYLPLMVATQILGGGATSRLFMKLREEKGYTYGSYARLEPEAAGSLWTAEAQTRSGVAQLALDGMRLEIARWLNEPMTEHEFAVAKRQLAGTFLLALSSPDTLSGEIARLIEQGRDPSTVIGTFLSRLQAVTLSDVQAAAKKYIIPAKSVTVAVGDRRAVPDLR